MHAATSGFLFLLRTRSASNKPGYVGTSPGSKLISEQKLGERISLPFAHPSDTHIEWNKKVIVTDAAAFLVQEKSSYHHLLNGD